MLRVALAGALVATGLLAVPARAAAPAYGVVAVIDMGIDPYHAAFRDTSPRAYRHPSTYLPGYPKDAIALRLSFDAPDYWTAVRRDCERVWSKVLPGKTYWFPGTRIVGAVSFDLTRPGADCDAEQPTGMPVLDEGGHGTMTASRAAGAGYGACPECLVVSVQFQTGFGIINMKEANASAVASVRYAGANASWIDAQSNSWGPEYVYDPTGEAGLFMDNPALTNAVEETASKQLSFWATGNGVANFGGVAPMPTVQSAHFTPSAIRVGGHDSGYVTTWPGMSAHLVADACDSWAAQAQTLRDSGATVGGGTSGATPYVAGGVVREAIAARRLAGDTRTGVRDGVVARGRRTRAGPLSDGVLTLAEWRDVLFHTATARPGTQPEDGPACGDPLYHPLPVKWTDVPAQVPEWALIGYGAVDRRAVTLAQQVLAGSAPNPERPDADAWFAADAQVRTVEHEIFKGP